MTSIRNFAYATLLAFTALNFAPSPVSAQEPARGKFTLTHDVHFGSTKVSAGEYKFSFDPDATSRMLTLRKLSGTRAGYLLMVPSTEDAKSSDLNRLILESTPNGSYVSALQLPEFGMTLHFNVPSHVTERQIAKAATTAAALGQ
jgi:hypothetical protein